MKVHYSFDYAQQVHYPFDPLQPGPNYFLMPKKCTVFGVACEALPCQINFLTDEAGDCGKGANIVISRLTATFLSYSSAQWKHHHSDIWLDRFLHLTDEKTSGIKKSHHFRVSSSSQWSDSLEVTFKLLKEPLTLAAEELPAVVPPRGLSTERHWYLYDSIHQFCQDNDKDTVCPLPFVQNLVPAGSALQF